MTDLRDLVFANLASAVENGHDFADWPAEDIAADLVAFAADVEDRDVEELLPHVRAWLAAGEAEKLLQHVREVEQ